MFLNFGRTRSPGISGHEMRVAGQPRRQNPPQRIGEPDGARAAPAASVLLIPTVVRATAVT